MCFRSRLTQQVSAITLDNKKTQCHSHMLKLVKHAISILGIGHHISTLWAFGKESIYNLIKKSNWTMCGLELDLLAKNALPSILRLHFNGTSNSFQEATN